MNGDSSCRASSGLKSASERRSCRSRIRFPFSMAGGGRYHEPPAPGHPPRPRMLKGISADPKIPSRAGVYGPSVVPHVRRWLTYTPFNRPGPPTPLALAAASQQWSLLELRYPERWASEVRYSNLAIGILVL
jgi:hypothetical protein